MIIIMCTFWKFNLCAKINWSSHIRTAQNYKVMNNAGVQIKRQYFKTVVQAPLIMTGWWVGRSFRVKRVHFVVPQIPTSILLGNGRIAEHSRYEPNIQGFRGLIRKGPPFQINFHKNSKIELAFERSLIDAKIDLFNRKRNMSPISYKK